MISRILCGLAILVASILWAKSQDLQEKLDKERALVGKCIRTAWQCVSLVEECRGNKKHLVEVEYY